MDSIIELLIAVGTVAGAVAAVAMWWLQWKKGSGESEDEVSGEVCEKINLLEKILSTRKMVVAYFDYPPLVYTPARGQPPSGIYPYLIKSIARNVGLKIIWKRIAIGELEGVLSGDAADCILCVFRTSTRNRLGDFCGFLHTVKIGAVSRKNLKLKSDRSIFGSQDIIVACCRGEAGHEIAKEVLAVPAERTIVLDSHDLKTLASVVQGGGASVAIVDSVTARYMAEDTENTSQSLKQMFRNSPLGVFPNGTMVPFGQDELSAWFDGQFAIASSTDEYKVINSAITKEFKNMIESCK